MASNLDKSPDTLALNLTRNSEKVNKKVNREYFSGCAFHFPAYLESGWSDKVHEYKIVTRGASV